MPPLYGTVALPQVHEATVGVTQELHLDVLGPWNVALEKHVRPPEGVAGFAAGLAHLLEQLVGRGDHPHATTAASESRLDDQRKPDGFRGSSYR